MITLLSIHPRTLENFGPLVDREPLGVRREGDHLRVRHLEHSMRENAREQRLSAVLERAVLERDHAKCSAAAWMHSAILKFCNSLRFRLVQQLPSGRRMKLDFLFFHRSREKAAVPLRNNESDGLSIGHESPSGNCSPNTVRESLIPAVLDGNPIICRSSQ